MYNTLLVKFRLVQKIGGSIARLLFIPNEHYEPIYKIEDKKITIYNFSITDDFIELIPTKQSYNLIDKKSRQIFINKDVLLDSNKKRIIQNVIRKALVETNQASEMDHVRILNDNSLLVTSDDWSDEIQ